MLSVSPLTEHFGAVLGPSREDVPFVGVGRRGWLVSGSKAWTWVCLLGSGTDRDLGFWGKGQ